MKISTILARITVQSIFDEAFYMERTQHEINSLHAVVFKHIADTVIGTSYDDFKHNLKDIEDYLSGTYFNWLKIACEWAKIIISDMIDDKALTIIVRAVITSILVNEKTPQVLINKIYEKVPYILKEIKDHPCPSNSFDTLLGIKVSNEERNLYDELALFVDNYYGIKYPDA